MYTSVWDWLVTMWFFFFVGESSGSVVLSSKESTKTEWTPVMDQYFIEIMLDQIGKGNKTGIAFSKQAWTDMLALFNARFSGQYGKRVLRHRYNKLLKYYKDMEAILKEDGFSWDEARLMIAADDAVWDAYIKVLIRRLIYLFLNKF